jgi:hypothetical protein
MLLTWLTVRGATDRCNILQAPSCLLDIEVPELLPDSSCLALSLILNTDSCSSTSVQYVVSELGPAGVARPCNNSLQESHSPTLDNSTRGTMVIVLHRHVLLTTVYWRSGVRTVCQRNNATVM